MKAARKIIEEYLEANWSATPIVYENTEGANVDEFIIPLIRQLETEREVMGGSTPYKEEYLLYIAIYTRAGIGAGRAETLADALEVIFKEATMSGLVFDVPLADSPLSSADPGSAQMGAKNTFYVLPFTVTFREYS